jgi:hypothetical protein
VVVSDTFSSFRLLITCDECSCDCSCCCERWRVGETENREGDILGLEKSVVLTRRV